jgi:hypothetical protein
MSLPVSVPRSRVFVVQEPLRRHPGHRRVEHKYSLKPAEAFGELVVLLAWEDLHNPVNVPAMMTKLREGLADFTDDDYVLAAGNPGAIAAAAMLAGERTGWGCRMLVWDNRREQYDVFELDLNAQPFIRR